MIVDLSADFPDHHKTLTSNWTSASKTSMLILLKKRNVRRREEANEQDKEDELAAARRKHVELNEEHGQLTAEAKVKGGFFFFFERSSQLNISGSR